jgi:hypothetical protein
MKKSSFVLLAASLLGLGLLLACESKPAQPAAEQKAAKPKDTTPVLYTGREAFQKMYIAARGWAGDARPFRLQSEPTKESSGKDGQATLWRAGFASASRRFIKMFVWSGSHLPDGLGFGISSGAEDTYNPSNASTQVFDMQFLKVDSDKAFEVAQQHGGDKLTKKDPSQSIYYLLEWNPAENNLLWHVVYGPSRLDAKLVVAVNATTGAFLRVEK